MALFGNLGVNLRISLCGVLITSHPVDNPGPVGLRPTDPPDHPGFH